MHSPFFIFAESVGIEPTLDVLEAPVLPLDEQSVHMHAPSCTIIFNFNSSNPMLS